MNAFQQMMDVIGNNIANVNTTAYKSSSTNFEDLLSQTLNSGSAGGAAQQQIGGTNPIQVGLGVKVASVYTRFLARFPYCQRGAEQCGHQRRRFFPGLREPDRAYGHGAAVLHTRRGL